MVSVEQKAGNVKRNRGQSGASKRKSAKKSQSSDFAGNDISNIEKIEQQIKSLQEESVELQRALEEASSDVQETRRDIIAFRKSKSSKSPKYFDQLAEFTSNETFKLRREEKARAEYNDSLKTLREHETLLAINKASALGDSHGNASAEPLLAAVPNQSARSSIYSDARPATSSMPAGEVQSTADQWFISSQMQHLASIVMERLGVGYMSRNLASLGELHLFPDETTTAQQQPAAGSYRYLFKSEGPIPHLSLEEGQKLIFLDREFIANSGLSSFDGSAPAMVLFLRNSCHDQMRFIKREVLENRNIGFISGSPGTGKSVITYFYSALISQDSNYTIVWICLSNSDSQSGYSLLWVVLKGGIKYTMTSGDYAFKSLLWNVLSNLKGMVLIIIDGYRFDAGAIYNHLFLLSRDDSLNLRFLFVSSMGPIIRSKFHVDSVHRLKRFKQPSWKLEEYIEALDTPGFFEHVQHMFDASSEADDPLDKLRSKHFYAGACARFMFGFNTHLVRETIDEGLGASDLDSIYSSARAPQSVNRLFSWFPGEELNFVSVYVHHSLSRKRLPDDIYKLMTGSVASNNPTLRGIMLEIFFFAIANENPQITLIDERGCDVLWETGGRVQYFNYLRPNKVECSREIWLRPSRNPGFCGVYLYNKHEKRVRSANKTSTSPRKIGVARFVQITHSDEHALKLQYFSDCARAFNGNGVFEVDEVEIFFIVPLEYLDNFRISTVESPTALVSFSWPKMAHDVKAKTRVLGLKYDKNIRFSGF